MNQQTQETKTKQKNPLRVEQGNRSVGYNRHKKQELKNLIEQITKQDDMAESKPVEPSNKIVGYLLYNKFKKPKQNLIDFPPASNVSHANTKIEPKRDTF